MPAENLIVGHSINVMALLPNDMSLGKTTNTTVYISAVDKATTTETQKNVVQVDGLLSDGMSFIRSLWYECTVAHVPLFRLLQRLQVHFIPITYQIELK